jgi:hypothetical protein
MVGFLFKMFRLFKRFNSVGFVELLSLAAELVEARFFIETVAPMGLDDFFHG